ncbi:hypothetical protein [Paenibacillus sp. FSL R5-0345]|nr:hypothetical protein [Paenibacillus sp. FSL R5-0345]
MDDRKNHSASANRRAAVEYDFRNLLDNVVRYGEEGYYLGLD